MSRLSKKVRRSFPQYQAVAEGYSHQARELLGKIRAKCSKAKNHRDWDRWNARWNRVYDLLQANELAMALREP